MIIEDIRMNGHDLIERFNSKQAIIGIVGLGYVGLPLALRYAEVGYNVVGFDIDQQKIDKLAKGQTYIRHIDAAKIAKLIDKKLQVTTDFSQARNVDAIILCVPTPLTKWRDPDLSFIVNTVDALLPHLRENQVLSLESTTYPGTTDEILKPKLQSRGFEIGQNFFLVYSPEREDPGNPHYVTADIPKVCGGTTSACAKVGIALYQQVIKQIVPVSSTQAAEMTKLLENIHRAVNIGLVNEMKIIADKMGIDIYEVISAAATKPFGFVPYYPGPGLGGHCIPIDPFYLTWKAREYGLHTRFIELAGEINSSMPHWVIHKTVDALNKHGKALSTSKILVLGIAYKKNVDDMRESPAVEIMELLTEQGATVHYSDPYVPIFPRMRQHYFPLNSVELTAMNVAEYDCVLITTAHDNVDYRLIEENAKLVIDTRGVYRKQTSKIIQA
jgi:UDP-N-acetyl-D-glucosamine dehydrogenase